MEQISKRQKFRRSSAYVDKFCEEVGFNVFFSNNGGLGEGSSSFLAPLSDVTSSPENDTPLTIDSQNLWESNTDNDSEFSSEYDSFDESYSTSSNYKYKNSVSEDTYNTGKCGMREELRAWSVKHNISHVALNDLLHVLGPFHSDLPKDCRTLLSTQRTVELKKLSNGSYYHNGLFKNITQLLKSGNMQPNTHYFT